MRWFAAKKREKNTISEEKDVTIKGLISTPAKLDNNTLFHIKNGSLDNAIREVSFA